MKTVQSRRELLRMCALFGGGAAAVGLGAGSAFAQYERGDNHWGWGAPPGQKLPPSAINGPWKNLRAVKEKKVFDLHVHGFETPEQGTNYRESGAEHAKGKFVNYVNELIASMDRHGIAMAALNPAFTTFEEVYEKSYLPHKDRFVLSAGWPPREIRDQQQGLQQTGNETAFTPTDVAKTFERQITENGAKMIGETAGNSIIRGLMPRFTLKELHPVIDVVLKHDVPVQIHTGWTPTGTSIASGSGGGYQTAGEWASIVGRFMAAFPDVKLILGHMGGQFSQEDGWEAVRLLFSFDNAYCDTSKSRPEIVTEAVKGIGAERVMFGSDWNRPEMKEYGPYFMRSSYQHWHNLNTIANADMTEDQRDWVLYKSARKLLKLGNA
jgi:predicted TIM-barrel fold metal-dependent hydrolase